jgi:hypothetical protein
MRLPYVIASPFRFCERAYPLAHLTDAELLAQAIELRALLAPEKAAAVEAAVRRTQQ